MSEQIIQLAAQLGQLCLKHKYTVSSAESCTGGGIAYAITSTPGSSQWFNQSVVTYANTAKMEIIHVPVDVLADYGAVSEPTIKAMALGCQRWAGSNLAIATSGIAGPEGGSEDKPVGTVFFAWAIDKELIVEKQVFSGDRHSIREQAIAHSLSTLIAVLEKK